MSSDTDSSSFRTSPMKIVRASKQYVYDEFGYEYLDCINCIAHVGHCHPSVVTSCQTQMGKLCPAQGFVNEKLSRFLKGLFEITPGINFVCYIVNSESEANDLALRLARQYTKKQDVIVFKNSHHGQLSPLLEINSDMLAENRDKKEFIHVIPVPASSLENLDEDDEEQGERLFQESKSIIEAAVGNNKQIACFFSEIWPVSAGVIIPPKSYFRLLYKYIHEIGGLCIDEEIRTGLGRIGSHFWAYQAYDVIPDIVTVGNSLGNGHPLGAVITTREIADSLGEFLTTFGGNPVACSIGLSVLNVIKNERLLSSGRNVGKLIIKGFKEMMPRHPSIGKVRGSGLLIGVELLYHQPVTRPATELAQQLKIMLKERRIIVTCLGESFNVIVITPPLCFTVDNARHLLEVFDTVLCTLESHVETFASVSQEFKAQ